MSHVEGINFGIVEAEDYNRRIDVTIRGADPTQDPDVQLLSYRMRSSTRGHTNEARYVVLGCDGRFSHSCSPRFSVTLIGNSGLIRSQMDQRLSVVFHPLYAGQYEDTLELLFVDARIKQRFVITRRVEATVGSREDHEHLRPTAPYVRRQPALFQLNGPINTSIRPPVWTSTKWVTRLPEYSPPTNLIRAAYGPAAHSHKKALANVKDILPRTLNETNYGRYLQILLYVEEEKMRYVKDQYLKTGTLE